MEIHRAEDQDRDFVVEMAVLACGLDDRPLPAPDDEAVLALLPGPADLALIAASLEDVLIEPQRKSLIPGFQAVKNAALARGALGCSISGAGPTMFAWAEEVKANEVRAGMVDAFRAEGIASDAWITRIEPVGARIVHEQ